jgi:multidrug efflux pump subunit AcrB
MVRSLVDFCVRRSVPVTLLAWTLIIGGVVALLTMRREFFPETAPQAARIVLAYPGASPKEIEESMARKIEDRVVDVEGVIDIAINAQGFWRWGYRCCRWCRHMS